MTKPAFDNSGHWLILGLLLLTIFVYYPGLSGDYMFDDMENLLKNKSLDMASLDLESLQKAAFSSNSGMLRRPVSMGSFALNRYFFGIAPYSHKVVNLVIHLVTGLLLYLLGRAIMRSHLQFSESRLPATAINWIPLVVAGLWLVHPLNLSSVLYIVQRMTSLAALFTATGTLLYVYGRHRMRTGRHGFSLVLTGLLLCGGLAVFSKENGILLPVFMLLLEMTLFRFQNSTGQPDRRVVLFFLLIVVLPALLAIAYLLVEPARFLNYGSRDFTLQERLLTEGRVLVFYLKMIVMPSISELGLFHDDIRVSHGLLDPPSTLWSLLFLAGLLGAALGMIKRLPLVSLGILWFFAGHLLESTLLPLEIAHEHRNYLADFGILLAVTSAIAQAPLKRLAPLIHTGLPLLFLALFASTTRLRSMEWSDNINHAVYEARHHPESFRSVFSAGRIHARLAINGRQDSAATAFTYLEKAASIDPAGIMPAVTMIRLSYLLERPVNPAWFDEIIDRLARFPLSSSDKTSLKVLAECYDAVCDIPHETMENIFAQALKHNDAQSESIYGYYTVNKRGDFDKGLLHFYRAVELDPRDPQRQKNLINLLTIMQQFEEAEKQLEIFRKADIYGSSEQDFRMLQDDINKVRQEYSTAAEQAHKENNVP